MTAMVFLAIIFIAIYIAYKIFLEPRVEGYWVKITVDIVLTMVVLPIMVNLLMPIFNLEEQRKNDAFQSVVTNAIVGKGLDRKELEDLIVRQRKEIFQSTEDEAQKPGT
jgi:hypothetical protein